MQTRRWLSPSQPDTLRNATLLLYFNGVFSLLGTSSLRLLLTYAGLVLVGLIGAAAAHAMANDSKWGYKIAVGVSGFRLLVVGAILLITSFAALSNLGFLISLLFEVVLLVLLLHPMSRDYQRIWFK